MSQAKKLLTHSSIYAIGNFSRQIVGFLMLPVYTRYLSPSDYGVVGLLIFMVTLIELLFGAKMFHAVPKFYFEQSDEKDRLSTVSTAFIITFAASLAAVIGVVFARENISEIIFGTEQYSVLVGAFAILIITQGLEGYALGWIRLKQRPWLFFSASMTKLVLQLSLNIIFVVVLEYGLIGVAISSISSAIIMAVGLTSYTLYETGIQFRKSLGKRMLAFSWPLWLSGIAGLYLGSSNRYFIRIFGSLDEVGLFELAARFGSIISVLVWVPFSQYWQTERFNLYKQANPIPIFQTVFRLLSITLMGAALAIAVFGSPVVKIMADVDFHDAARAIPFLVCTAVFQCLTYYVNFSFMVKEKTIWITYNSYGGAFIITFLYFTLIPSAGFVGASQALAGATFCEFLFAYFGAKKHYDMKLSLWPLLFCLAVFVLTMYSINLLPQSSLAQDIIYRSLMFLAAGAVLIGAGLTRRESREFVFEKLGLIFRKPKKAL